MLEDLRTRGVTGNRARDRVEAMSQQFDSVQWNGLCRRVIIKDFRCGISEKTLNKVLKNTDWAIPVFGCQLAQDSNGHANKMSGNKRLEVKLDGVRVLAFVAGDSVTLFSRNGKPLENFPHVEKEISENFDFRTAVTRHLGSRYVLDGEIVGTSFQALMRQAHRKSDVKTDDAVFHVFDIVPFTDFQFGHWNRPLHRRIETLENVAVLLSKSGPVRIMPGITVDLDTAEDRETMHRFAEDAVDQGFEGIMIKDLAAPYECRRNGFWLKWKPFIEVTLAVTAVEAGTGRNVGRLGALVCEGVDEGRHIQVNVGSGFSDAERDAFWQNQHNILKNLVEVRADAITQNQDGTYSLRFPRFLRFRGFSPGEKI
jgi:DNA ligase-1